MTLNKLSSINVGRAPAMIGRKNTIILLFKKDEFFHKYISYHCVIQLFKCIFWKKINALKTYNFLWCGLAEKMHMLFRISKTIKNCVRMSVV
jgi:hypothetical protein